MTNGRRNLLPCINTETAREVMGIAEPVIGRRFAPTRWLNPSYGAAGWVDPRHVPHSNSRRNSALAPNIKQEETGMTTRRNFIKGAAAGIAFCSCSMLDAAHAQSAAPRRLPVTVRGKRVKTIDLHSHCHFREAIALMGDDGRNVIRTAVKGTTEQVIVIEERLKAMDAMGIDMEVLSINPFWYRKDRDTAAEIVRVQNEKLA